MKAIQVKYIPATNTKGSRFKAWIKGNSITNSYDYRLSTFENAKIAANDLKDKLHWPTDIVLIGGLLPNKTYAFVITL